MHKKLSLRQLESTIFGRATGFNKTTVNEFFSNFKSILRNSFVPEGIFNVDETGISMVH